MSEQLEVWLDRLERLIDGEDHSSVREHLVAIKSSMLQRRDLHLDHVKTWVNRVRRQHAENNVLLQDSLNLVCGGEA